MDCPAGAPSQLRRRFSGASMATITGDENMRLFPGIIFLGVLVASVLGGCRARDPMDWKISASSPNDFNGWSDRNGPLLPTGLRQELARAIQFLQGDSGLSDRGASMENPRNPFCVRIDRKTVRYVILEGYFAEKKFLSNRVMLEIENIAALENRIEALPDDSPATAQLAKSVNFKHQLIQNLEIRLAEIAGRTEELERR
jgi:hypothetical protein